ncbi:MAG: hypothetical protein CL855_04615 [Cryomorphaceae bacterium]|nr:hypothetical protein [Cryomorphaceae bacterium]|tara:strand:- start:835 stop:1074 length:240 start_codon:yes stop_codon:yes gene_type:complete
MGSTKVKMPKPPKMPDPVAPPPAPQTPKVMMAPKMLTPVGATPDIRIGNQKSTGSSRNRNQTNSLRGSLNINSSKGLNV